MSAAVFHFGRARVREITQLVMFRHGGLPDTDDRSIYIEAVAHHLDHAVDLPWSLEQWGIRVGARLTRHEIEETCRYIERNRRKFTADAMARMLGVTMPSGPRCGYAPSDASSYRRGSAGRAARRTTRPASEPPGDWLARRRASNTSPPRSRAPNRGRSTASAAEHGSADGGKATVQPPCRKSVYTPLRLRTADTLATRARCGTSARRTRGKTSDLQTDGIVVTIGASGIDGDSTDGNANVTGQTYTDACLRTRVTGFTQ